MLEDAPKAYDMMLAKSEPFIGILIEYDAKKKIEDKPIWLKDKLATDTHRHTQTKAKTVSSDYAVSENGGVNIEKDKNTTRIILSTSKILNSTLSDGLNIGSVFILDIDSILSQIDYEATFKAFIYVKKLTRLSNNNVYLFTHNPRRSW